DLRARPAGLGERPDRAGRRDRRAAAAAVVRVVARARRRGRHVTAPVIRVKELSRAYGEGVALNEVSFDVEGGVVGLLGPNGAGKPTLLKILTGELRPSLGKVEVLGHTPFANPDLYARVGICPEQEALFDDLTAREFLAFFLRLRGVAPEESRG